LRQTKSGKLGQNKELYHKGPAKHPWLEVAAAAVHQNVRNIGKNRKTMVKIFESMMRLLKKQRGGNFSREFSWNCPDWGQSGLENRQES
jgi:hypothetical protein